MKVSIDPTKCQSTGYCVVLDHRHFRLTSGGAEHVTPVGFESDADGEMLREAESLCPTGAIRVIEG